MTLASTPDNPAPPGAIEAHIRAKDDVRLRTARWTPPAPKGTVVVLGGRGEFIEKYFEVIHELLARGFAVVAMDWRGQGGSDRLLPNPRKGHVGDFSHFERDLEALVEQVLEPFCPRPWFALAHSMGATVLLGVSGTQNCPFERLVLTAPMIAVSGVNHRGVAGLLVGALNRFGMGEALAPGSGGASPWLSAFEGNVFTTDRARFARIAQLIATFPELTSGGPTFGWTHAAFRQMKRLDDPNFMRRIATPILIVAAGADRVTDTAAARQFASRLATGLFLVIEGSEHEIMIERDALRAQFWSAFDQFVSGSQPNPPPAR